MTDSIERLNAALVGRYAIERELGHGGMAIVYLAEDLKHRRPVAIKVLRHELAAAVGADRFLREIDIAAHHTHPHILPIHDSGQAGEFLFYVMPYVAGESLRDRLTREKQLPLDDALQITRDVAKALGYAHGHGVVHRDIKPENILLSDGTAVVADFGIARAAGSVTGEQLTEAGLAIGTPAYMSPEQALAGDVDQRSDVYSLGCVLYELLVGQPPFTGPSAASVLAQQLAVEPRLVNALRPSVPPETAQAIARALAKTAADRFGSMEQLIDGLQPGRISPAGGVPAALPPRAASRRSAVGIGLTVVAALAAVAIYGAAHWRRRVVERSAHQILVAVLPFENLSRPEDEYFADGLTEEIAGRLAGVPELSVIARSSASQYKKTAKTIRQIGAELGVDYLLEGAVRWEKGADGSSRVRVSPRLIRVSDAAQIWAERYDAILAGVFEVQSKVAIQVAGSLGLALGAPADGGVTKPTTNLEAYDLYLRGNDYYSRGTWEGTLLAVQMYDKAVALDMRFAQAYARLGQGHISLIPTYDLSVSHVPEAERRAKAKAAIDRAIETAPDLAEGHLAMGKFLNGSPLAREEYATALRLEPNNAAAIAAFAALQPAQQREPYLRRAAQLDPRSPEIAASLGRLYQRLGRRQEAETAFARAIGLAPDVPRTYVARVILELEGSEIDRARQTLGTAEANIGRVKWLVYLSRNSFDQALLRIFRDEYRESVLQLTQEAFGADTIDYLFVKAEQYQLIPEPRRARVYLDSLRVLVEARKRAEPDQPIWDFTLAWIYAGLSRREQALQKLTAFHKPNQLSAEVHVRLGDLDMAIRQLEASQVAAWSLGSDPIWAPLRGNPRFEQLVQRLRTRTANRVE